MLAKTGFPERGVIMSVYCNSCGAAVDESSNYCPKCGASIYGSADAANQNGTEAVHSGWSNTAKTAAAVGGVVLGASALSGLARRMTHRRRPPYMPPMGGPPPMGRPPMGGPGGPPMGGHGRRF